MLQSQPIRLLSNWLFVLSCIQFYATRQRLASVYNLILLPFGVMARRVVAADRIEYYICANHRVLFGASEKLGWALATHVR